MKKLKVSLLIITLLGLLACSLLSTPEPPGVGHKADQGYAACNPIIAALEKYHIEKAKYPESLAELVPDYLATVPTEVNNEPIYYSKTGDSFALQFHYVGPGTNTCTYTPKDHWHCSGAY